MRLVRPLALAFAVIGALLCAPLAFADGSNHSPFADHGHWYQQICSIQSAGTRIAGCGADILTNSGGTPLASAAPSSGYGPAQFHGAYNLPTAASSTQTVAVVDAYDDPSAERDLATYSSAYGLPACTTANGCFRKVNETGGTLYPSVDSGWDLEISLDIEAVHAICENCHILLVEASSASTTDLGAAINEAVIQGAKFISLSWGAGEFAGESSADASYLNHPGVTITASAGDSGYGVEWPAASPDVVAVGGTTLNITSSNTYSSESIWSGSGSGCSAYEPKPSWQKDSGCSHRTVADVSADADPATGAAVYDSNYYGQSGWFDVGGTSLASPLIAAAYALGGLSSEGASGLYANTAGLHDLTVGSNGSCNPSYLCSGTAGYDGPSGLGSPNGLSAFEGSAGSTPTPPKQPSPPPTSPTPDFGLSISPSSQSISAGASASYILTLKKLNGFNDPLRLAVGGLPAGSTTPNNCSLLGTATTTCAITVTTTSSAAPGSYTITLTATDTKIALSHIITAALTVSGRPDFSLAFTPSSQSISVGGAATYTITLRKINGFNDPLRLTLGGLPPGATLFNDCSVLSITGSCTILVITSPYSAAGTYTLTLTGVDSRTGLSHNTTATLSVSSNTSSWPFTSPKH